MNTKSVIRRLLPALAATALAACATPSQAYELYPGEMLRPIATPIKGTLTLSGWTRDGKGTVYSLAVKKGEAFRFRFKPRNNFVGLVVFDAKTEGDDSEGLFSTQGVEADKELQAEEDTTWIIRPYYARMSPRRGLGAPYTIELQGKQ